MNREYIEYMVKSLAITIFDKVKNNDFEIHCINKEDKIIDNINSPRNKLSEDITNILANKEITNILSKIDIGYLDEGKEFKSINVIEINNN